MIRIGIDVGGTNTDAVVMDGDQVLAGVKETTTADVMSGVVAALNSVLAASGMKAGAIDVVMIGTTHFTNAVVQRRDLAPTAAVRLGLPATASLPPMVDWPEDLQKRDRQPCLSRAWRARVRRPRDFAARRGRTARHRRGYQSQGHSLDRDHLGVQSGQHRARNRGRSDFRKGAAGRPCHSVERHRPHRAAGARERGGDERVPARSRQARHRRVSRRARRLRRQGRGFS